MKRIFLTIFLSLITLSLWAVSYTLRPGALATVLREIEKAQTGNVVFGGEVFSSELAGLRHLPRCVTNLDLSQLTIKGDNADESDSWELPPFALFATNVRVLRLPSALTAIGEGAFAETPLESLHIPANVTKIGPRAFYNCKSLKSVNLSDCKITELADECFSGCTGLEELWLPVSLAAIGQRALMRTAVNSLVMPSTRMIGRFALAEMPQLSSITLRNGVEMHEGALFNTPKLQRVADLSFNSPALGFAMSGNVADRNVIEDTVISEGAFAGTNLAAIIIGKSVEKIEPHAFRNVNGLTVVDVTAKGDIPPELSEEAFSGLDVSKIRLRVLEGNEDVWRNAPAWKDFIIESSSNVADLMGDSIDIMIEGSAGMITVSSNSPLDYVGIYSLGGMVLFERHGCGETLSAGPFADKEVIIRAVSGRVTKVSALLIH